MTDSPVFLSETRSNYELSACGLKLNIGRQRLTEAEFESLLQKAKDCALLDRQIKMMQGEVVNASENRQALHTSLRSENPQAPHFQEVNITRQRMYDLARAVRNGQWLGATGKRITDVINVGIGGSEMGPHAVYHALREINPAIKLHFLSAVDGVLADRILGVLNPETTLAVISSKSFSTRETMLNAIVFRFGLGWVDGFPFGALLACLLSSLWGLKCSRRFCTVPTRWINTWLKVVKK